MAEAATQKKAVWPSSSTNHSMCTTNQLSLFCKATDERGLNENDGDNKK